MRKNINSKINKSQAIVNNNGSSIHEVSHIIANELREVSNTFRVSEEGYVLSNIGGIFRPSCREMEVVLENSDLWTKGVDCNFTFVNGSSIEFNNAAYRLYYEVLRRDTNMQFFSLELEGEGIFELVITAQTDIQQSCIFNRIIQLEDIDGKGINTFISELLEVNTLIANGSLIVQLRCLSERGYINKLRWNGHVRLDQANLGERIVAIRTFGNRASVAASLKAITQRISQTAPQVLERTLFVIYDATGDKSNGVISKYVSNARIVEMNGPNYGGGGNASALLSLIIRAGEISDKKISEVILFDDDAHIDAETIIRHDAFITSRKKGVISTSVVYSRQRPTLIQEYGGIWGRFFSQKNHGITLVNNDEPRLFFPYLVRSTRNVAEQFHAKYIGKHQDVEFSTFIFICFPYQALLDVGVALPFFLRNDDAEICLRMIDKGMKIVVNPNLSAWHDSAHNPIGEFYATLHGLIVNSRYGGISRHYLYQITMKKLSSLSNVGNLVLLVAYTKALQLYSQGPQWMEPQSIYQVYADVRKVIGQVMTNEAIHVPFEVVDVMKSENRIDIINIVETMPPNLKKEFVVFLDTKDDAYYSFKSTQLENRITELLEDAVKDLYIITQNFDSLVESWSNYIDNFDHEYFWNELLGVEGISITNISNFNELKQNKREKLITLEYETLLNHQKNQVTKIVKSEEIHSLLPKDFDKINYLRLNPDIAGTGIDPEYHWINHGRHENRQY
jgi:GT2 family glycosyltransferase